MENNIHDFDSLSFAEKEKYYLIVDYVKAGLNYNEMPRGVLRIGKCIIRQNIRMAIDKGDLTLKQMENIK